MLRRDSFFSGFVAGLICTVIFYVIFMELNSIFKARLTDWDGVTDKFIAISAVCTNLFPFLIFNSADKAQSMKGVIAATLVLSAVAIVIYRNEFF